MKRLLLVACVAALAIAQTDRSFATGNVNVVASTISTNGDVRHLTGNVVIETDAIVLHADQADYNDRTGEIRPQGNVVIKLK